MGKSDGEDIGGNIDGEVTHRPHKCIRLVLTTYQQTTAYRYEDEQMLQDWYQHHIRRNPEGSSAVRFFYVV